MKQEKKKLSKLDINKLALIPYFENLHCEESRDFIHFVFRRPKRHENHFLSKELIP